MNQETLETLLILCKHNQVLLKQHGEWSEVLRDGNKQSLIKIIIKDQIECMKFIEERLLEEQKRVSS